jgi:hypothetical protein
VLSKLNVFFMGSVLAFSFIGAARALPRPFDLPAELQNDGVIATDGVQVTSDQDCTEEGRSTDDPLAADGATGIDGTAAEGVTVQPGDIPESDDVVGPLCNARAPTTWKGPARSTLLQEPLAVTQATTRASMAPTGAAKRRVR